MSPDDGRQMLAYAALALSLTVRVYDAHGIRADTAAAARETAVAILANAGLRITWRQCPCDDRVDDAELVVRITAASPESEAGALGFSYVDTARRSGTLATVFADRVESLARVAGSNESQLLGRVMAHEIAHLLLGSREHAKVGLMRGRWTASELESEQPFEWAFSSSEATRIRSAAARRLRTLPRPSLLAANRAPGSDPKDP
jgi:hypothetical protein